MLDDDLGLEFDVGQNVSVGLTWRDGYASSPDVDELSIVRRGRVPGAEITYRHERPPTPKPPPAPANPPSAREEIIHGGPVIRRYFETEITVR